MRLSFDRGTLVLAARENDDHVEGLGLVWDPRVNAYRTPAYRYAAIASGLGRLGIQFTDEVRAFAASIAVPRVTLRPYQEAALTAWRLSDRRGVIILPTGSGKTRVALAAMADFGSTALCLVPTRMLVEQWLREIGEIYPHAVGCLGDGRRDIAPITVATIESAYRFMDGIGNKFDLLVVDEAHHFGCGARDEALEMSIARARLGLTATPPSESVTLARLTELIGPSVFELGISDLAGEYLADFDILRMQLALTSAERVMYEGLMRCFRAVMSAFQRDVPDAPWETFARWAARTAPGRDALVAFKSASKLVAFTSSKRVALAELLERHHEARVLVFTADNETAYSIAREHLIMPITCDIGRSERNSALARFRSGELRALVSARVLNEGVDVPDADVAIIVGAARGEREHVQRVGRMLRPAPGKRALVYELVMRGTIEVGRARRRNERLAPQLAAQL